MYSASVEPSTRIIFVSNLLRIVQSVAAESRCSDKNPFSRPLTLLGTSELLQKGRGDSLGSAPLENVTAKHFGHHRCTEQAFQW